jgi:eukaryotic-like serine/threonine-protein kinase
MNKTSAVMYKFITAALFCGSFLLSADATSSKSELARKSSAAADSSASAVTNASEAFERGVEVKKSQGAIAAIPFFQRAIDLDQQFPNAFYQLGIIYRNLGQEKQAAELFKRAFETRARANLPDRFAMIGIYYTFVTGEAEKAIQVYRQWVKADPRNYKAVSNLGSAYGDFCDFPQAIEAFRRASRLNPKDVIPPENLMELLTATGNFNEARRVYQEMQRAKLDDDSQHLYMYPIAVLEGETTATENELAWFADKPNLQHEIFSEQADAEAYAGHLARARELSAQAVAAALHADNKEQAAAWQLNAAWREELFGNKTEARDQLVRALSNFSDSREINAMAAILFARTGDDAKAKAISAELARQYPKHAAMKKYWLPCIRAQISLAQNDPKSALRELNSTLGYDLLIPQVFYYSHMPSIVLRAEAYAAIGRDKEAAEQWQKIITEPGTVQLSATAPIAKLRLAYAYAHQAKAGDPVAASKARSAFEDFFSLWNTADADISVLKQAKADHAKLCSDAKRGVGMIKS